MALHMQRSSGKPTGKRRPQKVGDVLAELMARRGYTRQQAAAGYEAAWREAAGELLAKQTRVGLVRRGAFEVTVANSVLLQELTFQKQTILGQLSRLLPDERIDKLRLRVGPIE
jgi:predicted nucleic acid-binding Zn ribbon protein